MPERQDEFEGAITIEWRPNGPSAPDVMLGWHFIIRDEDGEPILSVTEMAVHASADGMVWAELTMLTAPDGKPILPGSRSTEIHLGDDGEIVTGTFAYRVARDEHGAVTAPASGISVPDGTGMGGGSRALPMILPP